MKRQLIMVFVTLFLCAPGQLWAGVFSRDWKTPGDGLLTYDDVNQREWLDVPQSLLSQFPGATLEELYQNAILQVAPGGLFEGFAAATSADVVALARSADINVTTHDPSTNSAKTLTLIDLLGFTYSSRDGHLIFTRGLLNELEPTCHCRMNGNFGADPSGAGISLFSAVQNSDDVPSLNTGVWLYRQVVPEPSTEAIVAGLWLMILLRRENKRGQNGSVENREC